MKGPPQLAASIRYANATYQLLPPLWPGAYGVEGAERLDPRVPRTTAREEFCLVGGTYTVAVSGGTFSEGGVMGLYGHAGDNSASFSDNGETSVDLPPGDFSFDGANVTDWTGTVTG